jgi:glycosyltransferase involved in cell wall biosynthesis
MRVLILSHYYLPEPIPKPSDLAEELTRRGHSVSVVTGFPNYPSGVLFPGYKLALMRRETIAGIPAMRAFEFPYHGTNAIGRMLNYLSTMVTTPLASLFLPSCDVMYVWHPPLTIGVAAWLIARLRGIPFIYDVQDIWPESVVLSGMLRNKTIIAMLSRLERFVYRRAGHIFVVTSGARDNLIGKGVNPDKVSVMPHWIDEAGSAAIGPAATMRIRQTCGWRNKFVTLFAGNIGIIQGLDTVVRTAALLPRDGSFLISVIGDGADKQRLLDLAKALEVSDRIQFLDRRPAAEIPVLLEAADVLLVHLKSGPVAQWSIPAKTYAYFAAAKPILMGVEGAGSDLVRNARAGVVVPPEDPAAMAQAIRNLHDMSADERAAMGRRGREYLLANFSRKVVLAQYEQKLAEVAGHAGDTREYVHL